MKREKRCSADQTVNGEMRLISVKNTFTEGFCKEIGGIIKYGDAKKDWEELTKYEREREFSFRSGN